MIAVVADTSKPTVCVRWDAMPDVEGKEDVNEETQQVVPPRKFNKKMLVCEMGMMLQVTKRVIWSPMMDRIPATVVAVAVS